ncbi:MAG: hypothetical protein H0V70_15790 [Ktedonobacteraceae bacterium]|nr:hypothetical protein [Ktedonobacteraceae bacterium]
MLKDILREKPAFQQILEEGREEGRKEGLELGRQRILQSLRQKLLNLVQARYSELSSFAQERVPLIEQVEILEDIFFKVAIAATVEDARTALLVK